MQLTLSARLTGPRDLAEVLASAPAMLYALRTLRMNADLHSELGHATLASATFRELVYNVAGRALDRIGRGRPKGVTRNGG